MDIEILNRIILARHLYKLGMDALDSSNDMFLFAATNLLQDSVESFLLAVSDFVGAGIDQNTKFDKYFELINNKISPKELPFRNKLIRLNRLRINAKHYGIKPSRDECARQFVTTKEFFIEVSRAVLDINFTTASTLDLLPDNSVKELLYEAKDMLEKGDNSNCAINCRKAIFLKLEKDFDISCHREGAKPRGLFDLFGMYSRSPYYARNKEYIEKSVKDPTDFVVHDTPVLDQDLLKYSIDYNDFWNVIRLTPEVWKDEDDNWYVKRDFDKLEPSHIDDKVEYIFSTTVDIIYSISIKKAGIKRSDYEKYIVNLVDADVPIYEKADVSSTVVGTLPKELTSVDCDFSVEGFNQDGIFWHILYQPGDTTYISGYIHNDYLVWKNS